MGILVSEWHEAIVEERAKVGRNPWRMIASTVIELFSIGLLVVDFFYKPLANKNQFIVIIAFSLFLLATALGDGLVYRLFNRRRLGFLGRYSYSIYVMQSICFHLLAKWFWRLNPEFVNTHVAITLTVLVVFAALVGVLAYHVVERPIAKLLGEGHRCCGS